MHWPSEWFVTEMLERVTDTPQNLDANGKAPSMGKIERNLRLPLRLILFVQLGPKNGNDEMRKMRRALVQLQPTHYAMVSEIFRYARFRNSQMLG